MRTTTLDLAPSTAAQTFSEPPIATERHILVAARARRLQEISASYEAGLRARFLMAVHGTPGAMSGSSTCLRHGASERSQERHGGLGRAR